MLHASCDTCQANSLFVGVLPGIQQSLGKLGNQDQLAGYGRTLPKRHHCARRAGRAGLLITPSQPALLLNKRTLAGVTVFVVA